MKRVLPFIILFLIFSCCSILASENSITRQELCEIIISTLEDKGTISNIDTSHHPFKDTNNSFVEKAYYLGFIKGEKPEMFSPDVIVTKEQAAVVFKKLQDYIVPGLIYDNEKVGIFSEKNQISSYALNSVLMLSATDTIDSEIFSPKSTVSKAYVVDVLDRIYKNKNLPVAIPGAISSKKIPILMYHCIGNPVSENSNNAYLYVKSESFDEQIKYLSENGYTFLFTNEMYYAPQCDKSVVITFDDGFDNNYYQAFKTLKKYNAKATIFVIYDYIGKAGYVTSEQVREMSDSGLVNIQSHTMSHLDLSSLDEKKVENELKNSKIMLEKLTGKPVTDISYPYGKYSDTVLQKANKYYKGGFSVQYNSLNSPLIIPRYTLVRNINLDVFKLVVIQ